MNRLEPKHFLVPVWYIHPHLPNKQCLTANLQGDVTEVMKPTKKGSQGYSEAITNLVIEQSPPSAQPLISFALISFHSTQSDFFLGDSIPSEPSLTARILRPPPGHSSSHRPLPELQLSRDALPWRYHGYHSHVYPVPRFPSSLQSPSSVLGFLKVPPSFWFTSISSSYF